jgi:MoaA/NifB/PqqE/SkfB family radical SAM enzyme
MYTAKDVRIIHLEVTTRCNAACPQCPRNYESGDLNEQLPLAELSLDDVKTILDHTLVGQLRKVYLCGNYGDPAVCAATLDIVAYLRNANRSLEIGIHTNGGPESPHGGLNSPLL